MNQSIETCERKFSRRNQDLVLKWKGKLEFNTLTREHPHIMSDHVRRTPRSKRSSKPDAVIDYTDNLSGIDVGGQFFSLQTVYRKTVKWCKNLAFHIVKWYTVRAHFCILKPKIKVLKRPLKRKLCATFLQGSFLRVEDVLQPHVSQGKFICNTGEGSIPLFPTFKDMLRGQHSPLPYDQG